MEVATSVMVTVELDFGPSTPTIQQALDEIERKSAPEDGTGRTFAILDAYGNATLAGKLHLSMHVSAERPGSAALVFRRTGETLWSSRILPRSTPAPQRNLIIYVNDDAGNPAIIDGSQNPRSILDAVVRDRGILVRDYWPTGTAREVTLVYSACGCPVKVMARREGERTVRTENLPVIFPDDPPVMAIINRLMGWA